MPLFAQDDIQSVRGIPSREVYDLLIDRKDYLWVAHELGISRYDGTNFTHYTNPQQSSLSMTDIIEDGQGRIWCHNFSGQIFYIEHERMHLLKEYDYTKEPVFPRMVLYGDELVISSIVGIFVLNTRTFQSRYHHISTPDQNYLHNVTLLKDKVLIYQKQGPTTESWYTYHQKDGIKRAAADKKYELEAGGYVLQPVTFKDTIILTVMYPTAKVEKLVNEGNRLRHISTESMDDFVNTVAVNGKEHWIHARKKSYMASAKREMKNLNLSDLVTDRHGNVWMSSLEKGLLVQYKKTSWKKVSIDRMDPNDFVRRIVIKDSITLIGTQNGNLLLYDTKTGKTFWKHSFPGKKGSVNYIKEIRNNNFFLAFSGANPEMVNTDLKKIHEITFVRNTRELDTLGDLMISATSSSLIVWPDTTKEKNFQTWIKRTAERFPTIPFTGYTHRPYYSLQGRCLAVRYDRGNASIIASFKHGVYEIDPKEVRSILFEGHQVYGPALEYAKGKLFIGTFGNGLLIRKGRVLRKLTTNDGLFSNTIVRLKAQGNHLWIFENNSVQIVDIDREKVITNIDLPKMSGINVFDVAEYENEAYLTTVEGLYKVSLVPHPPTTSFQTHLNYVLVNNTDTITSRSITIPHFKNDIEFHLSTPWFNPDQTIYYKYRLRGNETDDTWHTTRNTETSINFASLMPGEYVFEAVAVDINGVQEKKHIEFAFTITRPWWKQWWFTIGLVVLLIGSTYLVYRFRLKQLIRVETMRRSISSDLHDDIGATLSSINIYSELAKKDKSNEEFLNLIQNNATDIITKLDDLVWSINPKNDSFEQLVSRMQLFAEPLLAGAGIHFSLEHDPELAQLRFDLYKKRNIYLIFKEAINNVVKHSGAKNCCVTLKKEGGHFRMVISDDGNGFAWKELKTSRNGLKNITDRAVQMRGQMDIQSDTGTGTRIRLSTPV